LLTVLSYAVIFQNQPLDLFMEQCETVLRDQICVDSLDGIVHSLIIIVQLGNVTQKCSHIARLCIRFLKTAIRNEVFQLLFSLAVYCSLGAEFIESLATEQYEMATNFPEHCWRHLAKKRSIYSALNANQTDES
jgi:hypothetical protein